MNQTSENKAPFSPLKLLLSAVKSIIRLPIKIFRWYKSTSLAFKIIVYITLGCGALHLLSNFFPAVADFVIRYPNALVRFILATVTDLIPFSLAEMVIMLLPIIVIILLSVCFYISSKGSDSAYKRYLCFLLSLLMVLYCLFVLTLAPGYKGTTLASKLSLEQKDVTAAELYDTSMWLIEDINEIIGELTFDDDGFSVMPYSLDEMNDKLMDAYSQLSEEYKFIPRLSSDLKFIILSEPMTYTHISGVYTFYTGEANLNVNFPDYSLPYTGAHELAHQRGTAPENEANFVAFLACMTSDDLYIRYSGYVNMLEYCMNALYEADKDMYHELYDHLDRKLVGEFYAYSEFYDKYRDNVVGDVSGAINDNYLQSQGQTAGSKSYGLVVDLTVAYYHSHIEGGK